MNKIVNVAIQVIPTAEKEKAYSIIDQVIRFIGSSGITYLVCPFETVVEGEYDKIMQLVKDIPGICYKHGAENVLINLKIQLSREEDVTINSKIYKYNKNEDS